MRRSLMIFIIKGFWTIVFIFIIISTTFRPICPPAFFRCLSISGTYTKLRTTCFIESTGVAYSDSVSHNWVQVLSICVDITWSRELNPTINTVHCGETNRIRTPEEGRRTYWPKRCGNNNEDNSSKSLNDKKDDFAQRFLCH